MRYIKLDHCLLSVVVVGSSLDLNSQGKLTVYLLQDTLHSTFAAIAVHGDIELVIVLNRHGGGLRVLIELGLKFVE